MTIRHLTRHLTETLRVLFCLELLSVAFTLALIAFFVQLVPLARDTQDDIMVYMQRVQNDQPIETRQDVERIIAGASHPGWILLIVGSDTRFVVRWTPQPAIEVNSRWYPEPPLALLLGAHVPARIFIKGAVLTLFPVSSVQTIAARTFGVFVLIALIAFFLANSISRRLADRTMRPLHVVRDALEAMAERGLPITMCIPEEGSDELRELIAAYNHAVNSAQIATAERDRAEERTHRFIADAGHQLRTPLTVLSGFIGILRKGQLRHPDDGPKILQKMEQQIGIMRKLVERLMLLETWNSEDGPMCEFIDIGKFVTSVVEPMASSRPDVAIQINTVGGVNCCVDTNEFRHAITNIVANAIKYAPDGTITVDVTADDVYAHLSVADQGSGIPEESLPHVFDRFYRGSRRDVPGSGLGLAIARTVVERAHGTIAVESKPGEGARFTITLPRVLAVSPAGMAQVSLT